MRDLETISTAITLAETGHLVLATLHTCNAAQTIDRIIDVFPPYQQNQIKSQLSLVLSAVISQVLVPKVSGGRTAIRELLINNPAIANLIREQKINQIKNVINTHSSEGGAHSVTLLWLEVFLSVVFYNAPRWFYTASASTRASLPLTRMNIIDCQGSYNSIIPRFISLSRGKNQSAIPFYLLLELLKAFQV